MYYTYIITIHKSFRKTHYYFRRIEEYASGDVSFSISEKDQRYIEEIAQRVRSTKGKSKAKSKHTSDKYSHSNSGSRYDSPREINDGKDQAGSL